MKLALEADADFGAKLIVSSLVLSKANKVLAVASYLVNRHEVRNDVVI